MKCKSTLFIVSISFILGFAINNIFIHHDDVSLAELSEIKQILLSIKNVDENDLYANIENKQSNSPIYKDLVIASREDMDTIIRTSIKESFDQHIDAQNKVNNTQTKNETNILSTAEQDELFYEFENRIQNSTASSILTIPEISSASINNQLSLKQHKILVSQLINKLNNGEYEFEDIMPEN